MSARGPEAAESRGLLTPGWRIGGNLYRDREPEARRWEPQLPGERWGDRDSRCSLLPGPASQDKGQGGPGDPAAIARGHVCVLHAFLDPWVLSAAGQL